MVDIEVMALASTAFIMAMAPGMALIWIFIAKAGIELFAPADTHAVQDKANPVLVPGTASAQSSQVPATCPVTK